MNIQKPANPIAVSSWSLHHVLGLTYKNGPLATEPHVAHETYGPAKIALMDLPRELAGHGYGRVEICHFHLASQEPEYLMQLRDAFRKHGVVIQTLLIDDGDITNPLSCERDLQWMAKWIKAAAILGAEHARVIAGKSQPTPEALALSIAGLKGLTKLGVQQGVRVVTENWFDLLSTPKHVHDVLDAVGSELGFLADMGNWHGASKYPDLQSIFVRAELCHAKCSFADGLEIDGADYAACLKAAWASDYAGPFTLIFDSAGDEWQGLERERNFIARANIFD